MTQSRQTPDNRSSWPAGLVVPRVLVGLMWMVAGWFLFTTISCALLAGISAMFQLLPVVAAVSIVVWCGYRNVRGR